MFFDTIVAQHYISFVDTADVVDTIPYATDVDTRILELLELMEEVEGSIPPADFVVYMYRDHRPPARAPLRGRFVGIGRSIVFDVSGYDNAMCRTHMCMLAVVAIFAFALSLQTGCVGVCPRTIDAWNATEPVEL